MNQIKTNHNTDSSRPIAIQLTGVKKQYQLGAIGGKTLQRELQSWWAKKRGKEDPNLRIGTDARLIGQKFMALNGVDLTVYKGERLGIIGSNGAGKSTMLKLLSRVTAPTEGDIDIYGRVSSMLEVGTGFHGEMTGRENIYMNGAILGMTRAEIDQKLEDIIEFSEVRDFIDTPAKRYSSGMFVKLAFSVAAHLNSEILIMDEVLAVGDMAFQKKCLEKMRRTADEEGRTILYVSHNMETIRRLCDRCIVLDQGKLVFDGDVEKAIAVYMDRSLDRNEVEIDLSSMSHTRIGNDSDIFMEHLTIENKVLPVFEPDESLQMTCRISVKRPLSNILFRMTMRTDSDMGLGTAWSQKLSFEEAGSYDISCSFPLNSIAKGTFYADIGFFEERDLGLKRLIDYIARAFRIQVNGSPVWYIQTQGFIRFEELQAQTVKNENIL